MISRQVALSSLCTVLGLHMLASSRAHAGFTSGSDGSDGALNCAWLAKDAGFDCAANCFANQPCEFIVDLSKARSVPGTSWETPGGDADGDGFGDGVYDSAQWAVVYKFTTIIIPSNVSVKFKNHRSGAPVVWLAQGGIDIRGAIRVNGQDAYVSQLWPAFSEPGPGGFAGGAPADTANGRGSIGYGPGSAKRMDEGYIPAGCYEGRDVNGGVCQPQYLGNRGYGNNEIFPLIGGSGGGAEWYPPGHPPISAPRVVGGAGGGAILIASDTDIIIAQGAVIGAQGGQGIGVLLPPGGCPNDKQRAGGGSGGAIRFVAGNSISGTGSVSAAMGWDRCYGWPGTGRVRAEAPTMDLSWVGSTEPGRTTSFVPGDVFPADDAPRLEVVSIGYDGMPPVAAPLDPDASPGSPDIEIDTDQDSQVVIRAWNVPVSTTVKVRVIPILGNEITATSTPLQKQPDDSLRATAQVAFPPGRSEIQLRANWTP